MKILVGDKVKMKNSLEKEDFGVIEQIISNFDKHSLYIRWNDGKLIHTPLFHFDEFMEKV